MTDVMPRPPVGWELRWSRVLVSLPYVLLAVLAGFTVLQKGIADPTLPVDLALCAVSALWMLIMIVVRPRWRDRPGMMAVFVTGLVLLMAVLVVRDPWFGVFSVAGYLYAFGLLPWPGRLAGVAAVAVVAATAQSHGIDLTTASGVLSYLGVAAANVLPMCGFAWLAQRGALQNEQRERALAEVSEANRRLEATLAENARLLVQAREAGVRDERQRMAREIHDTLAQGLTGIITQLQAAEHAEADPAAWRRHLAAATGLARESLSEARRSVHALRPEALQAGLFGEALAEVAQRWSARNGLAVEVTTTGTARPMGQDAEVALLRTAQEALANVAKHARAGRVGVTLSYLDSQVALDVRDDGAGFDPSRTRPGGFGLVAMRQRVEEIGGTLQVESEPGAGTAISACVPAESGKENA